MRFVRHNPRHKDSENGNTCTAKYPLFVVLQPVEGCLHLLIVSSSAQPAAEPHSRYRFSSLGKERPSEATLWDKNVSRFSNQRIILLDYEDIWHDGF